MTVATAAPASYRRLLALPGMGALLVNTLLTRASIQMWEVAVILLAIQRFHSPTVAGVGVFLLIVPGLVMSPVSGALLDRYGRKRLMSIDFTVAAACLTALGVLAASDHLPVWLLFAILAVGSSTSSLSFAGSRSLFPLITPRELWDRVNAVDSLCYGIAQVGGPALAGALTAALGAPSALGAAAIGYALSVLALTQVREPRLSRDSSGRVLVDAWRGLRYVIRNRTLRWLAVAFSIGNAGFGIMLVALPVIVYRMHGDAAIVGGLLALQGAVTIPAAIIAGRVRSLGRERQIIFAGQMLLSVAALGLLAPSLTLIALALAVSGISAGGANVAMFSLRQRRTDPAWFGRAFAVSMSLNFIGQPIGSALSGPVLDVSITAAILLAAALAFVSGLTVLRLVPAGDDES